VATIIKFEVTATNLNLADTADQTIYTFKSNTAVARVPTLLALNRVSGTGYTVGNRKGELIGSATERAAADTYDLSNVGRQTAYLEFYLTDSRASGHKARPIFRIPIGDINLAGVTTDGVTTGAKTGLVALPERVEGQNTYVADQFKSLVLRSNVSLSGGTGSLLGEFHYEEYPVNWGG